LELVKKRSPAVKSVHQQKAEVAEVSLTRGQMNARSRYLQGVHTAMLVPTGALVLREHPDAAKVARYQ
jgi:hypothetical protein